MRVVGGRHCLAMQSLRGRTSKESGQRMSKEEMFESPENWDFESAEARPPVRGKRTVVSVGMSGEEFQLISRCAHLVHMKVSEFIREAAVDKCRTVPAIAVFAGASISGAGIFVIDAKPNDTRGTATFNEPKVWSSAAVPAKA